MSFCTLRSLACLIGCCAALFWAQPSAAQEDDAFELDEPEAAPDAKSDAQADASQAEPAEGDEGHDAAAVEPAASEPAPQAPAPADTGTHVVARAALGGGLATRSLRRPVGGGIQQLATTFSPAADVVLSVRIAPEAAFSFDVILHYQTALGLVIREPTLFAIANEVDVRSERAELSVAPGFRFGDGPTSPRLLILLGASLRNFWPAEHHLETPRYVLIGPHGRVELEVSLGTHARLRAGPEVWLCGIAGTDLTGAGVRAPGVAYGGQVSLDIRLSENFLLEIAYRQSNATASSEVGPSFLDIERYAMVRLAGEM